MSHISWIKFLGVIYMDLDNPIWVEIGSSLNIKSTVEIGPSLNIKNTNTKMFK